MNLISVIITTYNWESALEACVRSLFAQQDLNFEIIIADDGSKVATTELVEKLRLESPAPLKHCFHEDKGFRAGTIRNKAVAISSGEYLLFIDGDCVLFPHFIKRHRQLAARGHFVAGNRVLLSQSFTEIVLKTQLPLHQQSRVSFIKWRFQGYINRLLPLIYLPFESFRLRHPQRWQKAMTCNLAIWKNDFIAVNGFDQLFEGWGYEDSDLVIRLIHNGIKRKEGRFAVPVLHLWHKHNDRTTEQENYQRLMERLNNPKFIRAEQGIETS
ncbi:MAG: glycosyltransferase [Methylococcaceae bacterium]|nr:glycosyltransferase [Methylococcaceae bacterium]